MNPKFTLFRAAYKTFVYHGFDAVPVKDGFRVTYRFEIPDLTEFSPEWVFPFPEADLTDPALRGLLFSLGMTELVSYWKCCCPEEIVVECGTLTGEQTAFWKKLYYNGLGEFFYRNDIDVNRDTFVTLSSRGETYAAKEKEGLNGALIAVGGGKDSVVSLELTKKLAMAKSVHILNPKRANIETARIAGYGDDRSVCPKRTIAPELLELNKQGFLNGHTPFSAILAFSTTISAYLSGKKYVVLSNESSANESTVGDVNHQYSKSLEFEKDFREYVKAFLPCGVEYFSLLRPFAEIRIARDFARYPSYFPAFLSCNLGSKTDSWCGVCPKCLFVYLMLFPFIGHEKVNGIFGRDLANDKDRIPDLRKLLGVDPEKPFECVGSREEAALACELAVERMREEGRDLPLLLGEYLSYGLPKPDRRLLTAFDEDHFVPDLFLPCLDDTPQDPMEALVAEFAGRKVAILGFGREGLSTYRYYRTHYPRTPLIIADRRGVMLPEEDDFVTVVSGAGYVEACKDADMVMIAPGIPQYNLPDWLIPKLQSQTRLFLKHFGDRVIGVTGTKGKSTCSSLIAATLPNAKLVGNIGLPVFDCLSDLNDGVTFVYELSCHQLEGCDYSPKTAVLTNLFEEHLDHYGSLERYYAAKKNVFRHQTDGLSIVDKGNGELENDTLPPCTLTYSVTDSTAHLYADCETGVLRGTAGSVTVDVTKLKLKGKHNLGYAAIAYELAKRAGVSDEDFCEVLYGFVGLPHRLEYVATVNGVDYYDDSISTTPQSAVGGLEAVGNVGTLILGGMERGIDLSLLGEYLPTHPVDNILLLPETGERLFALLSEKGVTGLAMVGDMAEAVRVAAEKTAEGKACLLSPAAASYHVYKNFEERGDHFKTLVRSLCE